MNFDTRFECIDLYSNFNIPFKNARIFVQVHQRLTIILKPTYALKLPKGGVKVAMIVIIHSI